MLNMLLINVEDNYELYKDHNDVNDVVNVDDDDDDGVVYHLMNE